MSDASHSFPSVPPRGSHDRLTALFQTLDKAVHSWWLYRGEGPILSRHLDDLARLAGEALANGPVTVRVAPFGLVHGGESVTPDEKRIGYLFRMYCDGLRELTVMPGIDAAELRQFVGLLVAERAGTDDDLVTTLWQRDLKHLEYYAVDSFSDQSRDLAKDASTLARSYGQRKSMDGSTQLAMTAEDLRVLQPDVVLEWVRGATAPGRGGLALEAGEVELAQAFEVAPDYARFLWIAADASAESAGLSDQAEASPLVLGVYDALLSSENLGGIAAMLNQLTDGLDGTASAQSTLARALLSTERAPLLAPLFEREPDALEPAFAGLVKTVGEGLVALLTALPPGGAESRLQRVLSEAGVDLTPFYAHRLESADEAELLSAVTALGRIGTPGAVTVLGKALSSTLTSVRQAALQALSGHYDDSMRVSLGRLLRDSDKANRLLAAQILADSGDPRVCWSLLGAAQHRSFLHLDHDEQRSIFVALARFKDKRACEHFAKVLSVRNPTAGKRVTALQILAIESLVDLGTPEAREILEKIGSRWLLRGALKKPIRDALSQWPTP
jgi:HEAT repeat protein